jgi:prepilin-type N-terminal cleavage/methylation domain-containing protein
VKTKRTVTSGKWQVARAGSQSAHLVTRHSSLVTRAAFTLIEIMVAVALLSLIVFALMTVFNTTQSAFRASVTQTDVLEGGRATMDLIANDLKPMSPTLMNNSFLMPNFYAQITNSFNQYLTASTAKHYNVMDDVFFITRENQTWKGIGYFVRTNGYFARISAQAADSGLGNEASLFRYETNVSVSQFAANQYALRNGYDQARTSLTNMPGVSKILDGVMSFKVRAFDTNGFWIVATNLNGNILAFTNSTGETSFYGFYSNALPASVEVELGVLEDRAVKRVESIQNFQQQTNYLAYQAGKVHIFRQRILIPNADPSAYQ